MATFGKALPSAVGILLASLGLCAIEPKGDSLSACRSRTRATHIRMFFAEAVAKKTKRRYELKEKLGEGGMGAVWRAFDTALEIDVAMKLLLDVHDPNALRLFYEECEKQAQLAHPNIVEIRDKGTLEDGSVRTPYIVMPLLRGTTLTALIRSNAVPLPTERCLDIVMQASRGLQAAHDAGLLHCDIKPSNLFVLEDDSVKLLDFGIARRLDLGLTTARKGTLLYMSPEQLAMKGLTRSSDVFSLGVVCYEMLTRQQPFLASNEDGVAEAIRSHHPPRPSLLNSQVTEAVSQVVCKAMAKNQSHRFATMREFSDALRRAQYDSLFMIFEPSRFEPRIAKARAAFQDGNLQYALEQTEELLSEGYLLDGLLSLDAQIKAAVKHQTIEKLMISAYARKQDGEYRLALQRVSEVLDLESHHIEALVLRHEIETSRTEADIVEWLKLGQQHLEKLSFSHAKQAAQRILEAQTGEERALDLLSKIERRQQEVHRLRDQKQAAYAAALEAEEHNEITAALSNMRVVLELEKQAPDTTRPAQLATYESFYNKLHAEHEAVAASYAKAKQALEREDFALADQLCDGFLQRMPQHTLFQALKFDVEQRRRRAVSLRLLEIEEAVESESDLGRRVEMLEETVRQNPEVAEFARLLESNRQKLNLVTGIVNRARELEARELYGEALAQWETLETIHPSLPRLQFEVQNLQLRRQLSERMEQKSRLLAEITGAAEHGELNESLRLLKQALDSMPDDSELLELHPYLRQQRDLAEKAEQLLADGRSALEQRNIDMGLEYLRAAYDLGSKVKRARTELVEGLLTAARASQERPRQACAYLEELLTLEPGNHAATGLLRFLQEQQERTETDEVLAQARHLRTARDLAAASGVLKQALARYPQSSRLKQFLQELDASRTERRSRDLDVLRRKRLEAASISDQDQLYAAAQSVEQIADRYEEDEEFQSESRMLKARLQTIVEIEPAAQTIVSPPIPRVKNPAFGMPSPFARRSMVIGGTSCACLLLAMLGLWSVHRKPSQPTLPTPAALSMASITIAAEPSGAMIRSNGKLLGVANPMLNLSLPAGETNLDADLPGYAPQTQHAQLAAGSVTKLKFKLAPASEALEVTGYGEMLLDGEKAVALHNAPTTIGLSAGEHTLTWQDDEGSSISLHAHVDPDAAASLTGWGKLERAMAVSTLNGKAKVYAAKGSGVMVDGKYSGQLRKDSIGLDLPYGQHALFAGTLDQGVAAHLDSEPGRQLLIAFGGRGNPGSLTAVADVDGANVKLMRGTKMMQQGVIAGGHLDLNNISAGKYVVVATLAGVATPFSQQIEIKPQQQMKITLPFQKALGTINVHAPAGVQITLDGAGAGQTGQDGTLVIGKVALGSHSVDARVHGVSLHDDVVINSQNVAIARDVSLEPAAPAAGVLALRLTPADAQVAVFGSNDQKIPTSGSRLEVAAGKYRIEASDLGYVSESVTVDVAANQTLPVEIKLSPANASSGGLTLNGWDASQWTLNTKAHTLSHTDTNIGFYATKPATGSYIFSGVLSRSLLIGWQKVQWVVGYHDAENCLLFTLSRDSLAVTSIIAGKKSPPEQFPMHNKGSYQVMLHVGSDEVALSMRDGDHWNLVHTWKAVKQDLNNGNFGFKETVTLTGFLYSR